MWGWGWGVMWGGVWGRWGGSYRCFGHEDGVKARLGFDVFAISVVQNGLEALPVLDCGAEGLGGEVSAAP